MSDLSRVPLIALSLQTQHLISTLLNPPKVIPSSNGLLRDWRGLAQVCSIGGELLPAIASDVDPTKRIINIVQTKAQNFTLKSLKDALENIERWDILDDSEPLFEKDAELYINKLERSQATTEENDFSVDADVLTFDDQFRIERGEGKQHYDAFLLYADEDEEFAQQMIENLEKKNHLKLCLKERDLVAGITFEHEAIMRLISERCNRLITIISPDFLKSSANKFFVNFAQATGIDKGQERKIIPCVYKNCELPPQLTFYSKIYYKKVSPDFFWDKLIRSMRAVQSVQCAQKPTQDSSNSKVKDSEKTKKINTCIKKESEKKKQAKENSFGEASKTIDSLKSRILLPWKKDEKVELTETPKGEESKTQDSVPSLPSLDGLESLSPLTSSTNSTTKKSKKKKKFMNSYVKRMQSLLTKS